MGLNLEFPCIFGLKVGEKGSTQALFAQSEAETGRLQTYEAPGGRWPHVNGHDHRAPSLNDPM